MDIAPPGLYVTNSFSKQEGFIMIKKLQALKAKKGFTLVELIVVIAIIGVLAAILIPTLGAQIMKAKVTSADSTAKELLKCVNAWIGENLAASGNDKSACDLKIVMNKGTCTLKESANSTNREGAAPNSADAWSERTGCISLKERIETDFSSRTFTGSVFINSSGYVVFAWCVVDKADFSGATPNGADYEAGFYSGWKSQKKEGVNADGMPVGTYPKLGYKVASET